MDFPDGSVVKNLPANAGDAGDMGSIPGRSPELEDPLEKEMATHSSIHTCRIPWIQELGRLHSMGHKESDTSQRLNDYINNNNSLLKVCTLY